VVHGDLKGVRNCLKARLTIVLTLCQLNIFVDDSGCPRITDFGLAANFGEFERRLALLMDYPDGGDRAMQLTAPEILGQQETYSKEADVFSFAMIMVEVRR